MNKPSSISRSGYQGFLRISRNVPAISYKFPGYVPGYFPGYLIHTPQGRAPTNFGKKLPLISHIAAVWLGSRLCPRFFPGFVFQNFFQICFFRNLFPIFFPDFFPDIFPDFFPDIFPEISPIFDPHLAGSCPY